VVPKPGSNIGEAIRRASQAFEAKDRSHKVMILVTDGENLEGDPLAAAGEAKEAGIVIYSIGVGTGSGEPIPLRDERGSIIGYKKDEAGSVVVSRLDEATLREISSITGGQYYRATPNEDEVQKIYQAVSQMDKKEFESKVYLTYVDRFQMPLAVALFLIFVESLISDVKTPSAGWSWLGRLMSQARLSRESAKNPELEAKNAKT
jgi:Ca-activated chloride channel family protein